VTWSQHHSDNIRQPRVNREFSFAGAADWVMKASHGYLTL
jgi:hypothetical protein